MKKLCIFPYSHDFDTIQKYSSSLRNSEIAGFSSINEDAVFLRDKSRYSKDIESILEKSDELLLLNNDRNLKLETYMKRIDRACARNKTVRMSRKLYSQLKTYYSALPYEFFSCEPKLDETDAMPYRKEALYSLPIPVISVLGLGRNCDKFETLLLLNECLTEQGYRTASICQNDLGSLFGMFTFPAFLSNPRYTFEEKIYGLNRYIYRVYAEEKPDVLLIGFPGGIAPLSENEYHHFSELPIIISNAISVDFGILNIYALQQFNNKALENMRDCCWYKYNIPIEAFCLSRQIYEYDLNQKRYKYYFMDEDYLCKYMPSLGGPGFTVANLTEPEKAKKILLHAIESLGQNPKAL